ASIIDLDNGSHSEEVPFRKLRKTLLPEILLVSPATDATTSRLDPVSHAETTSAGHWLWRPVRSNWNAWLQIITAAFAINLLGLALPIFVMNVYDRVIPNLAFVTLWTLAIGVAIAVSLDMLMKLIRTNVLETMSRRVDVQVASDLYRHAMSLTFLNRPGGAAGITNRIRDFEGVRDFFTSNSFIAVIDLVFVVIFIAALWVIVGPLAYIPLAAVVVIIIMAAIAQIPIARSVEKAQELAVKRHAVLVESLMGHETIKSLNAEPVMLREWENAVAASSRINGQSRFWSNVATSSTMLVQQGVSISIIIFGVYLVSAGEITIGALIAANLLAGRVLAPLGNISQTIVRAQQAFQSLSAVSSLKALPTEVQTPLSTGHEVKAHDLEFRGVSFTYPEAPVKALDNVSFKMDAGETIALLGRVGSGKSTLGRLIAGFMEPEEGLILLDGHELGHIGRAQLRESVGYMPQDPVLFTGTIRENLVLGRSNATDDEVNKALYYAGMDVFISENPEGLDQFIGEKGDRLSGGQRQAIGLARLLLRKPKLLFLDEPTSAMDTGTENTVIQRLRELSATGVSMILCTHRQSLAANADRFVVMDRGRKVLDGPKTEVIKALSNPKPMTQTQRVKV
ncbi:MAG: type I secretion system permease/ATPase, partial [Pseudomonadota bacterium]